MEQSLANVSRIWACGADFGECLEDLVDFIGGERKTDEPKNERMANGWQTDGQRKPVFLWFPSGVPMIPPIGFLGSFPRVFLLRSLCVPLVVPMVTLWFPVVSSRFPLAFL